MCRSEALGDGMHAGVSGRRAVRTPRRGWGWGLKRRWKRSEDGHRQVGLKELHYFQYCSFDIFVTVAFVMKSLCVVEEVEEVLRGISFCFLCRTL